VDRTGTDRGRDHEKGQKQKVHLSKELGEKPEATPIQPEASATVRPCEIRWQPGAGDSSMKPTELIKDLRTVFLKHFRPTVDKEPIEAQLVKMIVTLQKQQTDLNKIRDGIGDNAKLLNNSEVFKELDKLCKLAPSESGGECVARSDRDMDRMFI
jgi:hypothetical protein